MASEMLIVPIFFLTFFGMIFGIVYIRNKENMALIERGFNPRNTVNSVAPPKPFISLKYGLLLCGLGIGLLLAFLADQYMINHHAVKPGGVAYERDFPQIYIALLAIFGGLGLVLSYHIEKKCFLDKKAEE